MEQTDTSTAGETPADQRAIDRYGIGLPISINDGEAEGETLDISENGILYETAAESQPQVGATVALTLEYALDGRDYRTRCVAEVVRIELVGNRANVATRLLTPLSGDGQ